MAMTTRAANEEKANALRGKTIEVKLRRGYKLKMGSDGRGRDHTVEGPKTLTLDGQTIMNSIIKFEDRNRIREELGLPQKAMQRSLRDKMAEVQMRRRAEEDTRFMRIAEEAARNVLQADEAAKTRPEKPVPAPTPKKGRGRNRAIRAPARDR